MIKAVIIGHGELPRALLDAAERIVGPQPQVEIISNIGLSGDALCERIHQVSKKVRREMIFFVDLPGGSCTISCIKIMKNKKSLNILSGMNLPMLLEFFLLREKYKAADLIPILIKKAKDNIVQIPGPGGK